MTRTLLGTLLRKLRATVAICGSYCLRLSCMPRLATSDHYTLDLPAGHRFPIAKYALIREQLLWQGIAAAPE